MLVSVIVPIYNTERYLPKCLDSIIGQTYRDLQIILIDDGSTDRCSKICDEYAAKDSRIEVIHQPNGGSVRAREAGMAVARGEYIAWVDSDDYIAQDAYERMCGLAVIDKLDVVWCDVCGVMNDGLKTVTINYADDAGEMIHRILRGEAPGWLWNKLVKRSFYASADLRLYPEDSMLEDVLQSVELLLHGPKMGYVNRPLYYYNRSNESGMTAGSDVVIKGLNNIKHVYDYLTAGHVLSEYKDDFACLAMKAKFALLLASDTNQAIELFPYAHRKLAPYRMQWPASWIYWLGFNGGCPGAWLITSYLKMLRKWKVEYRK